MPRDPAARPVTTGYAPLFGAPPPPIHEDRVHVYSKHMQMTLPSFGEAFAIAPPPAAAATQDRGPMPPLSPGPPLRGYAAEPLLPASAATSATAERDKECMEIINACVLAGAECLDERVFDEALALRTRSL